MCLSTVFLILTGAGIVHTAHGLSLPFSASSKDQVSDNTFDFQNVNNVSHFASIYTTELEVAGEKFIVQLDTGSSDLWLDTTGLDLSSFTDTGVEGSITYGDGTSASGPILIGNVTIGSFSTSQAFISAPGTNATTYDDKGLLGVGPPLLSQINDDLSGTSFDGQMFLQNVFDADPSLEEFITFALSRSETTGTTSGGIFTIGEIASNLTAVSNSPKLPVVLKDRWVTLMDGIIVNGRNFSGDSAFQGLDVPGQTSGQTLANLDTGTGLGLIPKAYADAIYGSVPGSFFDINGGVYVVPCDAKINVSFVFGGIEYPIHPIDTVQAMLGPGGVSIVCFNGFLPVDPDPRQSSEDFLLGDSFMRSVYAVFNFGSFISGTTAPSIQLLSTIDPGQAYAEFDSLSAQRNQSLLQKSSPGSGTSDPNSSTHNSGRALSQTSLLGRFAILAIALSSSALVL